MPSRDEARLEVQLRVADARQRDVGRGIARIDYKTMQKLKIEAGDVIEIVGKRTTAAITWPAYAEDQDKDVIRIDGFIRRNAGVSINEYVIVKPAKLKDASSVTLAPVGMSLNVDEEFTNFVKSRLMERPLVEGDTVPVMMLGHTVSFTVVRTRPHGVVRMTYDTAVEVLSEPAPELKGVPRITYEDIGGLHEEIQRIREMVELPLRHPEVFQRLGIEPPKGVLLHGPPGCGKTLLAKAVANEAEANFLSINGPEIMSKFYGESEARLREIFQQAQQKAPSIIFIDEIDAIAPKREEVTGEVERRVVAQLLALMDGLEERGNVIVIGATNRPNAVDPALRRPGRFDREIEIGVPDKRGRFEILQIHTRGMPLSSDVDLRKLADITHGYTGADIAALCRETAMKALRRYLPEINLEERRIPPSVLEKMEVRMGDFSEAYKEITPTAMREVYVEVPTVRWEDIGGLEDVKQELKEAVEWPLKNPEAFKRMGIRPPKGILLLGPPGCGKTLLARAVATESEANFVSIKGPEVFCLPADTKVLTREGIKTVAEVSEEDEILAADEGGTPTFSKIIHKWASGRRRILAIKLNSGFELRVSEDHRIKVRLADSNEAFIPAKGLRLGDVVLGLRNLEEILQRVKGALEDRSRELENALKFEANHVVVAIERSGEEETYDIETSTSNFVILPSLVIVHNSKWVGESERAIREVFRKARMAAPAVIFFDEFDALVPRRGLGYGDSGVTERVISQLLTEVDGLVTLEDVVVIAATNRPDIIDPALLRPGRFDKLIYVPPPDEKARMEIFKIYVKDMPLAKDVNLNELVGLTKGYSGADIEALCREAALNALRRDISAKEVTKADFNKALEMIGPSLPPDVDQWYKPFLRQVRRAQKPTTPVA